MTIEVVLWDFGGVFTSSPFVGAQRYSESLGLKKDDLLELVFGPYHKDTNHPWHCLERGELSLKETEVMLMKSAEEKGIENFSLQGFFESMSESHKSSDVDRNLFVETARDLKSAGIKNCIITNNIKEFTDSWKKMVPMDLFSEVVDSSVEGIRKPNPEIFEMALMRIDSTPDKAVFLDDALSNIKAAVALGITSIHVVPEDPVGALKELRQLTDLAAS